MILYAYTDPAAPTGFRAFSSFRGALKDRAARFRRKDRPEILQIETGTVTKKTLIDLLSGNLNDFSVKDIA